MSQKSHLKNVKVLVPQSWPTLCNPMDYSPPGFSLMGFSRQEYCSGLPFPSPDLPNPGIKLGSPALLADSLPASYQGIPKFFSFNIIFLEEMFSLFLLDFRNRLENENFSKSFHTLSKSSYSQGSYDIVQAHRKSKIKRSLWGSYWVLQMGTFLSLSFALLFAFTVKSMCCLP